MSTKLRKFEETDLETLKTLFEEFVEYHSQFDDSFRKIQNHGDCFVDYVMSMNNDESKNCIVAEMNGEVVGYCIYTIERKPPVYPQPVYGYIDNLCVSSLNQNMGIGTKLLEDAVERLRSEGIERIECMVAIGNPKSTKFWRKMKFKTFMEQMYISMTQ
jgi:ribosomal protein S18 acetylase RimI-like enzyme